MSAPVDTGATLVVLGRHFTEPGSNYKRDDSAMVRIFAQL